jgi:putative hydrolase of the HAD superfamily
MIDLFVFDLGNVILPFNHHPIADKLYARSTGNGFDAAEIFRYVFDYEAGAINALEEGVVSATEFYLDLKGRYGLACDFEEFAYIWNNIFYDSPEVNELIKNLKARNFPVFLLSNTNEIHFAHIIEKFPVVHLLDEWILSFEVGAKKPKRRIFEAVFEKTDVRPERVLYIDDVAEYVDAACALGMQGLVFRGPSDIRRLIDEE